MHATMALGAAPSSGVVDIAWNDTAVAFRAQSHAVIAVRCPPGGRPSAVVGTDVYTDDSSICTAALHAGRVSLAMGGVVTIELRPPADGYVATLRNGIASSTRARAAGSFSFAEGPAPGLYAAPLGVMAPNPTPPPADPWTVTATAFRGSIGIAHSMDCPPGTPRTVWGTDVYTDDSSICSAALHAGRITAADGGPVTFFALPGRDMYFASERHGVTSTDYGTYPGSFAFDRTPQESTYAVPPGVRLINGSFNATTFRGEHDAKRLFCPPDLALHTVWGSGDYTDDSSICSAAIHAGRIDRERGGAVVLRPTRGRAAYHGSTAHGVTTQDYGTFAGSFVFEP